MTYGLSKGIGLPNVVTLDRGDVTKTVKNLKDRSTIDVGYFFLVMEIFVTLSILVLRTISC